MSSSVGNSCSLMLFSQRSFSTGVWMNSLGVYFNIFDYTSPRQVPLIVPFRIKGNAIIVSSVKSREIKKVFVN